MMSYHMNYIYEYINRKKSYIYTYFILIEGQISTEQSRSRCAPKYRLCEPLYLAWVIFLFCYKNTAQGILAQE